MSDLTTVYCILNDKAEQLFTGSLDECSLEVKKLVKDCSGWLHICKIAPVSAHHGSNFPERRKLGW